MTEPEAGKHDFCGRGRGCRSPGVPSWEQRVFQPGVVKGVSMVTTLTGYKGRRESGVKQVRIVTAHGERGRDPFDPIPGPDTQQNPITGPDTQQNPITGPDVQQNPIPGPDTQQNRFYSPTQL